MRTLDLRNENGEIDETALPLIWSVCFYPDDAQSRQQCIMLLKSFRNNFSFLDESHEQTQFEETMSSTLVSGEGVRVAAGIVTIFLYRIALQEKVSRKKYQAAKYSALFIKRAIKKGPEPLSIPWRQGAENLFKHFRVRTSQNNLTSAFDEYSMIGPLMAARIITANDNGNYQTAEDVRVGLVALLRVTQEIEDVVFSAYPEEFVNAWQVSNALPVDTIPTGSLEDIDEFVKSFPLE